MARILLVGTATLDLVYTLDRYPQEDDEVRARELRFCRGGNAANSAVVLAQLGHACSFVGVLAEAPETAVIRQDFSAYGVDFSACPVLPGRPPTSSIYLSGPHRTIVHYRDLPELSAEQFGQVGLQEFDWVHFEGRNVPELVGMLARVRSECPGARISVELEKPRTGIEAVWGMADVLICSGGYARHLGHEAAPGFLEALHQAAPQAELVVAWGEAGAWGVTVTGNLLHAPAFPPPVVVDTLGAGDTFNAALIDCLVRRAALGDALVAACQLAGNQCGVYGLGLSAR